jgi:hypothetical protein
MLNVIMLNIIIIVKNPFGLFMFLFSVSSVIYKSYRQVLTPVNNSQHLLRPPIFNKTRLVAFHKTLTQRNYTNWFLLFRENESAHDIDTLHIAVKMIVADHTPFD